MTVGSRPDREPLLIWGAGAMGGSIGAWLVDAGHAVEFVDADADHVHAINERGLTITGPIRSFRVEARAWLPDEVAGRYHTTLLCVKAHHTAGALRGLASHVADDGCVVSVQNGLNEGLIAEAVGENRTVGAFVNFGADVLEPGVIMRGNHGSVVLGELDGTLSRRVQDLQELLVTFEPGTRVTDNIFGYLWSKLAYGALLFGTAVTNGSIADALEATSTRRVYLTLGREVCAVAVAAGQRLEAFDGFDPGAFLPGEDNSKAEVTLADLVAFNRKSAKTHSGIWRDLAVRKRTTEADAQLGAVVRKADVLGVPVPLTRALLRMVLEIESGEREQADANVLELLEHLE